MSSKTGSPKKVRI